mgnify:CR=1 FL=1
MKEISSVLRNLILISAGSVIFGIGLKSIAIPHGFITGGISGLTLLIYYVSGLLSPGLWYLALNVPIFLIGWVYVSRRFFFYSLYGMAALCGIGFTMSLFIGSLAFNQTDQQLVFDERFGIVFGSLLSGVAGAFILHKSLPPAKEEGSK